MKTIKLAVLSIFVVLLGTQFVAAQGDVISAADLSKKNQSKRTTDNSVGT